MLKAFANTIGILNAAGGLGVGGVGKGAVSPPAVPMGTLVGLLGTFTNAKLEMQN